MSKVLIVGGGAAGMFAAVTAGKNGHEVHLFEKNEKLGKKLFITGKGRCNLTNDCDMEVLFSSVMRNSKFLYSSFYGYNNLDVIRFFEEHGMKTKTERGGRVFPESDHSSDVLRTLEKEMKKQNVRVHLQTKVCGICTENGRFHCIERADGNKVYADACIVATGGLSYQTTGATGDGYRFAEKLGHSLSQCMPSLVPAEAKEAWVPKLQGLSLKNVEISICKGKKQLYKDFGEMLFTHYGVSGPVIISASSQIGEKLIKGELQLQIDLKPALSMEQLDQRLLREFEENKNRQFKNAVVSLFPAKLLPVMLELGGVDPEKKVNEISREERQSFAYLIKHLTMTLTKLRDYNEAIITRGGIKVKEINPGTMESKLVEGLYFAGEVLDLDALTGGFNLQIAWSTGYAAGSSINKTKEGNIGQ